MKTPRNKSFLSHLLGWISEEASDDMNRVAKKMVEGWWQGWGGGFLILSWASSFSSCNSPLSTFKSFFNFTAEFNAASSTQPFLIALPNQKWVISPFPELSSDFLFNLFIWLRCVSVAEGGLQGMELLGSRWDLSSPTRDGTHAPCSRRVKS